MEHIYIYLRPGKGESIWDHWANGQPPGTDNGRVTADSFHKLDDDVLMLSRLGVRFAALRIL